jgi:hypothetical protein
MNPSAAVLAVLFLASNSFADVLEFRSAIVSGDFKFENELNRCLTTRLKSFSVENADVATFANRLASCSGLSVCDVSEHGTKTSIQESINLDLQGSDAKTILGEMQKQAPRYLWKDAGDGMIYILPAADVGRSSSLINLPVRNIRFHEESFSKASSVMRSLSKDSSTPITGIFGTGMALVDRDGKRIWPAWSECKVSIDIEAAPFIDALGALYKRAGPGSGFRLSRFGGGYMFSDGRVWTSLVETDALAKARSYIGSSNATHSEAIELFWNALKDAPYENLRRLIAVELGETILNESLRDTIPCADLAEQLFALLLANEAEWQEELTSIYGKASDGQVRALVRLGRSSEALDLAAHRLESEQARKCIGKSLLIDQVLSATIVEGDYPQSFSNLENAKARFSQDIEVTAAIAKRQDAVRRKMTSRQIVKSGEPTDAQITQGR